MGYDIEMVRRPESAISGYEPQYPSSPEYFRAAGVNFAFYEAMYDAGVLDDADPLEFPDFPASIKEQRFDDLIAFCRGEIDAPPDLTDEEHRIALEFIAKQEELCATRSRIAGKVPRYKFLSNDNWLVSSEESLMIAEGLDRYIARAAILFNRDQIDALKAWSKFNRIAADHGGYYVH